MKHTLKLHYSVQNGGDGSAYPTFMSSGELAEWDQDHMTEGWAEPCIGKIDLESDSPITVKQEIKTPESYLIDLLNNGQEVAEFIEKFFPDGKPNFSVITRTSGNKKYLYNDVFFGGVKVGSVFRLVENSGQKFEDFLNS